ncbi:MAG TPA: alpha/beta hydrolase, partial [Dongiaceae bacterium]|nr:alpha/beta hydrolase [Dongiaceae bacterium]
MQKRVGSNTGVLRMEAIKTDTIRRYALATTHGWIGVAESGRGRLPLLLIHSNSTSGEVFRQQMAGPLALDHHLIAVDLPGHGRSGNALDPARSYTLPGLADAVLEVLEMIGIRDLAIFGWSLGGHVALQMAPQLGDDLKGLMITGTPPVSAATIMEGFLPSQHMLRAQLQHFSAADIAAFGRAILGDAVDPALCRAIARADGLMRKMLFENLQEPAHIDQRWLVENLVVPLAVVNGAADTIINLDYIDGLDYANLWRGRCHRLAGLGHAPFWQMPELFNPLLRAFL